LNKFKNLFFRSICILLSKMYTCILQVGAIKNFDLERMMGCWYVVQYYASTEELPEYACMRSHFSFSKEDQHVGVTWEYLYNQSL